WKRQTAAAPSRCCLAGIRTHIASPTLTTSSGASGPASGRCVSICPMIDTQWSPSPSSSSWAFSSPPPPTSSSLAPPPVAPTMWWSSSSLPLPSASPISTSLPSSIDTASVASSSSIRWTFFVNLNYIYHFINDLL
ncbi:hypothetical protein GW17_00038275, partial [Ensete ventricosum]